MLLFSKMASLTVMVCFNFFQEGTTKIGRSDSKQEQDIGKNYDRKHLSEKNSGEEVLEPPFKTITIICLPYVCVMHASFMPLCQHVQTPRTARKLIVLAKMIMVSVESFYPAERLWKQMVCPESLGDATPVCLRSCDLLSFCNHQAIFFLSTRRGCPFHF